MSKFIQLPRVILLGRKLGFKTAWVLPMVAFLTAASAQSVWDGGDIDDNNWNSGDNWVGNVAPVPSATTNLQFDGTTRLNATNNFTAGSNFQNITFNSGAGAFTLSGNSIGLSGTGAADGTGGGVTNSSELTQNVNLNLANGGTTKAFVSTLAGGNLVMNGILSGSGSTIYSLNNSAGRSAITLNGVNTNSGSVFVYGQNQVNTVFLGNNAAFGSGAGVLNLGGSNKGIQLVATGGARSIANAVTLSAATDVSVSVGGENDLNFNGLVSGSNTPTFQTVVGFNTSGTTRFNSGIRGGSTSSSFVFTLAGSGNVEIAGNVSNNGGSGVTWMLWNNSASLTLSGTNSYTGGTRLYGGNVILDYSTNNTNKLSDLVGLTLGGVKLSLSGGSYTEAVLGSSLIAGASSVSRTAGTSTLTLNAISRAAASGGTVSFSEDSLATTDTLNSNGILGTGWALVGDNWAVNSTNAADGAIVGLTSYASAPIGNSLFNYLITASGTVSSTSNISSLKINAATSGQSLTNNAAMSFRAGILMTGTNDYSIGGSGSLSVGGADEDLKIYVNGSGNLTITSNISNRASFATPLTKSGSGKLILSGTKTFTGAIFLNQGTLSADSSGALGGGTTLNLLGGTLEATESFTLTRSGGLKLGTNGSTISVASGKTLTLAGDLGNYVNVSQAADTTYGSLTKSGAGTLVTTNTNTYTGGTTITAGVLSVSSIKDGAELLKGTYADGVTSAASGIGASTSNYRNLVLNGGTLKYTGATTSSNRGFTIGTAGGSVDASGSGALTLTGQDIFLSGTNTARTFTLAGSNTDNNTLTGPLADNGTGKTALVKSGAGTWVLTGTNTYSGSTLVTGGTLVINGSIASSAVTVNTGATLGGSGTVGGLTIATGGTLAPGNSPGNLSAGATLFDEGGNYNWQILDATGLAGTAYDTLTLTTGNALTIGSTSIAKFNINLWSLSSTGPDVSGNALNFDASQNYSWTLVTTDQTISGFSADKFAINVGSFNGTDGWSNPYAGTFSVGVSGTNLVLNYSAAVIPEPSSWALLTVGLTSVLWLRRRRNRRF